MTVTYVQNQNFSTIQFYIQNLHFIDMLGVGSHNLRNSIYKVDIDIKACTLIKPMVIQ